MDEAKVRGSVNRLPQDDTAETAWSDPESAPVDDPLVEPEAGPTDPVDQETYERLMTTPLQDDEELPS